MRKLVIFVSLDANAMFLEDLFFAIELIIEGLKPQNTSSTGNAEL